MEVDYYLGRAYHLNNQFDKADQLYQKFMDEVDEKHALRPAGQARHGADRQCPHASTLHRWIIQCPTSAR